MFDKNKITVSEKTVKVTKLRLKPNKSHTGIRSASSNNHERSRNRSTGSSATRLRNEPSTTSRSQLAPNLSLFKQRSINYETERRRMLAELNSINDKYDFNEYDDNLGSTTTAHKPSTSADALSQSFYIYNGTSSNATKRSFAANENNQLEIRPRRRKRDKKTPSSTSLSQNQKQKHQLNDSNKERIDDNLSKLTSEAKPNAQAVANSDSVFALLKEPEHTNILAMNTSLTSSQSNLKFSL
jgi:hypothetical protein